MAITRRGYREVSHSNSRYLRTRVITAPAIAIRPIVRKSQQSNMKCITGGTEIKSNDKNSSELRNQVGEKSVASSTNAPSRLGATSLLISDKEGAICNEQETFDTPTVPSGPSSPRVTSTQPPSRPLHCETEESKSNTTHAVTHIISNTTAEVIILDPSDVGIPNETKWDVDGGYNSRFCFEHEQKELLLLYADRWMRPSDFDVHEAETKLEIKLRKYQEKPWSLEPDLSTSQVECDSPLLSHLDTPIQQDRFGGENIYLCRWKLCWIPETDIDDKDWAKASCRAQDERSGRRRSAQIDKKDAYKAAKFEQIMRVINLENLL